MTALLHLLPKCFLQAPNSNPPLRWVLMGRCQKDENVAAASNSPVFLEPNPSPHRVVIRPKAESQIWKYKTC